MIRKPDVGNLKSEGFDFRRMQNEIQLFFRVPGGKGRRVFTVRAPQRKFLQEVKMGKEPPTKKQIYYYEKLCKRYNVEKKNLSSKLEARDEIDRILTEYSHPSVATYEEE